MSLINDALKQAKHAQQRTTAPISRGPQFRPAAPTPSAQPVLWFTLAATFLILGMIGLALGWYWLQKGTNRNRLALATPIPVQAQSVSAPAMPVTQKTTAPPPTSSRGPVQQASRTVAAKPAPAAPAAPKPKAATPAVKAERPAPVTAPAAAPETQPAPTQRAAPANPPRAASTQAAPLKLQAIFFNPSRPSAMISGRTVYTGDQVGGWRVVAINRSSTTLAAAGFTNVLSLAPQ